MSDSWVKVNLELAHDHLKKSTHKAERECGLSCKDGAVRIAELEAENKALRDVKEALKQTINKDTETIAKQAITIHKLMHRGPTG